jgi:hypothetical protein
LHLARKARKEFIINIFPDRIDGLEGAPFLLKMVAGRSQS